MRALVQLALLVVGGLVLGGLLVMGVKQHDFKRCDQSGFCARQRAFARWVDAYHGGEVERERGAGADAASAVEVAAAAASEDATAAEDATASGDATAASDDATPSTPAWTGPPPQPPVLYLDRDSLRWDTERGTVTGQLHVESAHGDTSSPPAPLAFSLRALHGGETLHVVVDEPVPSSTTGTAYANSDRAHRARARVDNVLVDGVLDDTHVSPFHSAHLTDDDGNTLVLSFGDGYRATVRLRPFALDVWRGNVAVAALNGKGYLNVERMRGKRSVANAATAATAAAGDTSDANYDPVLGGPEDGPMRYDSTLGRDRWAESFNGHRDDKPFGPMSIGIDISFPGSSDVYGIPEHASTLSLKNTRGNVSSPSYTEPYRLYNLDVFEFELDSPMALYGSVPFMMSHKMESASGSGSQAAGFFWLNAAEMWVDVDKSEAGDGKATGAEASATTTTHWIAETGMLDAFIMLGPTPKDVLRQYYQLTGSLTLPQQFALGYHQCRWNYLDSGDVARVHAGFEEHDISVDVLWLDIEHTNGKRYFTWHDGKFPDPVAMQKELAAFGRKMVTIIDPHIYRDDEFHVKKEATEKGLFVKTADGREFDGWCWPGSSSYVDYLNPAARQFWMKLFAFDKYIGSTETLFTWNDMNEPSVFSSTEITMQKTNLHWQDVEHRDIHNIYGMLLHRSTYSGHIYRSLPSTWHERHLWDDLFHKSEHSTSEWSGRTSFESGPKPHRPFVLSRAFFSGTQRYGAIWNGDNMARWSHLESSAPMLLTISLAGIGFCGADVGGFFFDPNEELLTRWYQAGAWYPFFRAHAHIETKRREPWLFGEPYTTFIRAAISTRYQFLPYWYTLFRLGQVEGIVPMRPMFFEFPNDANVLKMEDQYMVGGAVMVKPVVKPAAEGGESIEVYLPGAEPWYSWYNHLAYAPSAVPLRSNRRQLFPLTLSSPVPVLLCAGSVIPTRQRARRSVALAMHDPLTLTVTLTRDYRATGEWYLDDGESFLYTRGHFFHKIMSVTGRTGSDQVSHRSLHMNVVDKNLHHARARHNNTAAHARAHNWQRPFLGEVNARTDEDMWLTTNPEYLAGSARRVGIERIVVLGVAGKADPSTVRLRIRRGDDGAPWSELDASLHAQIRVHRHADAPFGQEVAGSNGVLATWELIIKNPGVDAGQDWAMSVEW